MKMVIQRVTTAAVSVDDRIIGHIERGLAVLLGVANGDSVQDAEYLANKLINLRIFEDDAGKMNRSLLEVGGAILLVSQFTLLGDCRKGRRPGFSNAAPPAEADRLYQYMTDVLRKNGVSVETGQFQAHMLVTICNDGPVTFVLDSKDR